MCMGVMVVLEGYRDGGIVEGVGVSVLYAFTARIYFYLNQISYSNILPQAFPVTILLRVLRISVVQYHHVNHQCQQCNYIMLHRLLGQEYLYIYLLALLSRLP